MACYRTGPSSVERETTPLFGSGCIDTSRNITAHWWYHRISLISDVLKSDVVCVGDYHYCWITMSALLMMKSWNGNVVQVAVPLRSKSRREQWIPLQTHHVGLDVSLDFSLPEPTVEQTIGCRWFVFMHLHHRTVKKTSRMYTTHYLILRWLYSMFLII